MDKIFIIGPDFFNYTYSAERAYKLLGFETRVITYYGGAVTSFGDRLSYHLSGNKAAHLEKKKQEYNASVLQMFNEYQPDLLFIIQGSDLYVDTVEKMKGSRKKVLWMYDSIFRNTGGYNLRHKVDHLFVFENSDVPRLWENEKLTAHFLPSALDESVYYPTTKSTEIDLLFVGTLYEERINLLEKVRKEFGGRNSKFYGNYYSPFRRPGHHLFRKNKNAFTNKNVTPAFANELYNKSRICLNMHQKQNIHGANQRFFEICGSKAFQLSDTNEYIGKNFSDNEVMTYTSDEDLFEKIRAIFRNDVDINAIAENGYRKVITNHTFKHRMKYVLDVIKW